MDRILHTKKDIAEEDKFALRISDHWKCMFVRYPQMARLDWFMSRGDDLIAMVEMKRRYNDHDKYDTVYLAASKYDPLYTVSRALGCKGLMMYAFDDGAYYIEVGDVDATDTMMLGRYDREDVSTDIEPMILVPVTDLTLINLPPVPAEQTNDEWIKGYTSNTNSGSI